MLRVFIGYTSLLALADLLYIEYLQWLDEQGKGDQKASSGVYSSIFNTFNIGIPTQMGSSAKGDNSDPNDPGTY